MKASASSRQHARLLRLGAGVDLDEQQRAPALPGDLLRQRLARCSARSTEWIASNSATASLRLVGLQRADQVQLEARMRCAQAPAISPSPPARGSRRTRAGRPRSPARSRRRQTSSTPRSASPMRDRAAPPHTRPRSRRARAQAPRRNSACQRSHSSRNIISPFREISVS